MCQSMVCRPRESGDAVAYITRRWIPAFAGMTSFGNMASVIFTGINKGLYWLI